MSTLRLGLISDTHGYLDPAVPGLFQDVDHILHGGDVGSMRILHELEQLAPITAVLGNTDGPELGVREREVLKLGGLVWLVQHIVDPLSADTAWTDSLTRTKADIVLFGHTHKPFDQQIGKVRYLNPGYAGRQRFDLPRSVAILEVSESEMNLRFLPLTGSA